MNFQRVVGKHFNKEARRFDAIYEGKKPIHQRVVDFLFRRVVVERFKLVCNLAPYPGRDWTALDIGCGSGRYGLALAELGALRVFGIDIAPKMIDIAKQRSRELQLDSICESEVAEFIDHDFHETFDNVLALGYFDYQPNPDDHLEKMYALSKGRVFASFPKRWEFRSPIRKLRFLLQGAYVRFYSKRQVNNVIRSAKIPVNQASVLSFGRDYLVIIRRS